MIKSICIVRLSALGDVLMIVPLIRLLQTYLSQATITWVISPPAYDLVAGMEGIEFIVIDKPSTIKDYWRFKKRMQTYSFDVLLAAQASFRANLLYPLIKAQRKIGYDRLRAKDGHHWVTHETIAAGNDHTLDGFLKFAKHLSLPVSPIRWDLPITVDDREWAQQHLPPGPVVLINAAASKDERSWLIERYIKVIQEIKKCWPTVTTVLVGGPGAYDRFLADSILQQVDCLDLVGKTKPKQLLAVIQQSQLLICPDTGPSHMAAAVGTPVIALHAVTSSEVSGPYLFKHLAVDCYPQAVINVLKKEIRQITWGTHVHGKDTMSLVSVEEVLTKIKEVLPSQLLAYKGPALKSKPYK